MLRTKKNGCHGIMEIPIRNDMTRDTGDKTMTQNTTINPRTGLKIAKPCFYEKKVAPRTELKSVRACEYAKAKPNKSYQIKATQGRSTTYYTNSSNSLTWPTLLLAIIFVPIAFVWFVLKFFILPIFIILFHLAFITCIAHR